MNPGLTMWARIILCLAYCFHLPAQAQAAVAGSAAQGVLIQSMNIEMRFADDGAMHEVIALALSPTSAAGVARLSTLNFPKNTSGTGTRFIRGQAKKPDGVSYAAAIVDSDKSIEVHFRNLVVGDTINYVLERDHPKGSSGGYSSHFEFGGAGGNPLRIAALTAIFPPGLKMAEVHSGVEVKKSIRDGLSVWTFQYRSTDRAAGANGAVLLSTYTSYSQIAEAYRSAAGQKSRVTPAVKLIAEKATQSPNRRAQLRDLFQWVQKNIAYRPKRLEEDGFVPRSADEVLASRSGDCKDHVVLLEALLASKGIASLPVLVNSGPSYVLPELVMSQAFDHVITYVPEFSLYADATNKVAALGVLSLSLYGKPVLPASASSSVTKGPEMDAGNRLASESRLDFTSTGGLNATINATSTGVIAAEMRATAGNFSKGSEATAVRHSLTALGFSNPTGTLSFADQENADVNVFSMRYSADNVLSTVARSKLLLAPVFRSSFSLRSAVQRMNQGVAGAAVCYNDKVTEKFIISLPHSLRVVELPKAVRIDNDDTSYISSYTQESDKIFVARTLVNHFASVRCNKEQPGKSVALMKAVSLDLNAGIEIAPAL